MDTWRPPRGYMGGEEDIAYEKWLMHKRSDWFIWDMAYWYRTWLTHTRHEWFVTDSYETWRIHMGHDSFIFIHVTYIVHVLSHVTICLLCTYVPYVGLLCTCETWLIHMRHGLFVWDMTHSYKTWLVRRRHDAFRWVMPHSYETWLIHMRHDAYHTQCCGWA